MAKKTSAAARTRKKKVIKPMMGGVDAGHFVDREISWLEFNDRVLSEAIDPRTPLLERIRFFGIFHSNLDEFYMKRVGELKRKIEVNPNLLAISGLTLLQEYDLIRSKIIELSKKAELSFETSLKPELAKNSIFLLEWKDLTKEELKHTSQFFKDNLFPILTPLAVDPAHPFPFISNLSTSLGITLRHPGKEEQLFARVKIPKMIPQWILLYDTKEFKNYRFISIIDIVTEHLPLLFPGMEILSVMPFRMTRNADWDPEDENDDLVKAIEEALKDRRFAECIRLEFQGKRDEWMIALLKEVLDVKEEDIYEAKPALDFTDLKILLDLDLPNLKFKPWTPVTPTFVHDDTNLFFHEIKQHDILVHHPYESFSATVEKFIRLASVDPQVMAIKMTLYRTGDHSLFVKSLIKAAEMGKQVVCLVELKARFDEERNIYWAQQLEKAGVHVVYGVVGLKTHTKTALVIRKENDGTLGAYAHIGTGNYHSQTSNLYTDLGLFTCNKGICDDLVHLFHFLTGRSMNHVYENLLVAPFSMKTKFLEMIDREIAIAKKGKEAQIVAKMNSMEDIELSEKLYFASQAGVKIVLLIRGFCCLKPGVPGLSENIQVISIIGRFLEHSRIFFFKNGSERNEDGEFYFGSADWMFRNLNNRVEVVTPVFSPELKKKCWHYLETMMKDERQAWDMKSDGSYKQRKPSGEVETSTHEVLMMEALRSVVAKASK
ncbi:MAG: polyphosphate kinase 1 [Bacteriovoracaceae bacterium]